MSEREHSFENKENQEQQLIRLLKEKGVEDPQVKELLLSWNDEQEKEIEKLDNVEHRVEYRKAQINFELKKGRLFLAAGYIEESFDNFNGALDCAEQEGFDELCQTIEAEMQKIENSTK